ncbi:MAG: sigma-70 family RNA polymerase sigma factor [Bacteroidales bacterium]|nr:sigma-70 family RNA polymerase sigma factor [Bacteroidales bacterium]
MANPGLRHTDLSDLYIVKLALEGDQKAFHTLYSRYNAGVKRHVGKYIHEECEIEDVISESFQKAFSQLASYDSTYKFSTWIYRIARNTAFDHIEKNGKKMPTTTLDPFETGFSDIPSDAQNPEKAVIDQEDEEKILACIELLKDDYRQIAKMNLIDNYGYAEMSKELGIPLNTIKTKVRRAKQQIQKMMESEEL